MKIFKRALAIELMSSATGIFLIILGIVVAQRAGNILRQVARGVFPNDAIGTILSFSMINQMPIILSLAIFLAVLLTLTRWHRDSEMVIWFGAGLSLKQWVAPILSLLAPVIIVIAMLSLFVMPWTTNKAETYRDLLRKRDEMSAVSPGTFKESSNGERIYFIESFDKLGYEVKNIFVHVAHGDKTSIITAQSGGRYKAENGDNFLVLHSGHRYETTAKELDVSMTEFKRYDIRIESKESEPGATSTQAKSTKALLSDATFADYAEFQWRLAIPLSALVLVLMAIPLSFVNPRAGRSLNVMFAVLIFIIYNNLLSIFQAWVTQGKINHWIGLWPVHLSFFILTLYLYYRRQHLQPLLPALLSRLFSRF